MRVTRQLRGQPPALLSRSTGPGAAGHQEVSTRSAAHGTSQAS